MHRILLTACTLGLWTFAAADDLPKPIFYLPLDGSTTAAVSGGGARPQLVGQEDVILTLVGTTRQRFLPGKVGQCYDVGDAPLVYRCAGNFRPDEGACGFWLSPNFHGDDTNIYCTFFGAADWGMLYKYLKHTSLTFGTAKPERDLYYDCNAGDIKSWRPGEWHHVVVCWSRKENQRRIYVDGKRAAQAPFPFHRESKDGPLFIGAGCTLYPNYVANAKMDEVAIWDGPLSDEAARGLYDLGTQGKALSQVDRTTDVMTDDSHLKIFLPKTPRPPTEPAPAPATTATREIAPLDGWWDFVPSEESLATLPEKGWGLTHVPGYWTSRESTINPNGEAKGKWNGRALSEFSIGYHQRTFPADPGWKDRNVFLQIDGVDGLAAVFLNGERIGWLSSWEPEAYDIGAKLRYGEENVVTIALCTRGGAEIAGIYGHVYLRILPNAFVEDVVVHPSVDKGRIGFSCNVCNSETPMEAKIEFGVVDDSDPDRIIKTFSQTCHLAKANRSRPELSGQAQRVECSFDWSDARLWTYDDPFLYRVRACLFLDGRMVDESLWHRFGFREFTMRGSDFLLNGKPTHLRGHQIDFAWPDQMDRVKELKSAGMNCFECSGPIRCSWYAPVPYREQMFEEVLSYADEHGLIALPILPAARVLKDRIFDPQVARLYHRRVEKHIRRYGNHPSICMWYMNFNLAGYHWYHAPTKIDGSYKPTDDAFKAKERYSLEVQRIVRTIDDRPIYHHACGNFGDIFTLNCYIGPTSPLQEREEWPSRWAEKRPFPLIACEHCMLLIPYWFRPRQFPLSVVYAGEPIFDELTAKYLGRRAYGMITPELFDLYDTDKEKPRGARTRSLIQSHPGYQEVKSLFARYSLRSWRTYGVSGIIFNAINWDFKDDEGKEMPVMKALVRYFGDTDLYIGGPDGDWPSKDHCFFAGENIRKQIVLLNDLTRDVECSLVWRLEGPKDAVHASGWISAIAQAGRPTMLPIKFTAPNVGTRTDFTLDVHSMGKHFKNEGFPLTVFPRPQRANAEGRILVFDPAGETGKVLKQAGINAEPLTDKSDPASASLVIVGKKSYGEPFLAMARKLNLEQAVRAGLNLLAFEQTAGNVFGLDLHEQSARRIFIAQPGHVFLKGLCDADFINLRGESDLIEPYPDAPPETEKQWPKRYFKWGNRGVVATFVYTKPHYAPFTPVLECGFDLVDSPLMEAKTGAGRIVLCQVDVTSRYGADPVSTQLVSNLLAELSQRGDAACMASATMGDSAKTFLGRFGIAPVPFDPSASKLVFVGEEQLSQEQTKQIESAANAGATIVFLPGAPADAFGLKREDARFFIVRMKPNALFAGLNDGDLYMKKWVSAPVACAGEGWEPVVEPGIAAVKKLGSGRLVACSLDPDKLVETRGRIKALRFWSILLANLDADRLPFLQTDRKAYEANTWEEIPPFINW